MANIPFRPESHGLNTGQQDVVRIIPSDVDERVTGEVVVPEIVECTTSIDVTPFFDGEQNVPHSDSETMEVLEGNSNSGILTFGSLLDEFDEYENSPPTDNTTYEDDGEEPDFDRAGIDLRMTYQRPAPAQQRRTPFGAKLSSAVKGLFSLPSDTAAPSRELGALEGSSSVGLFFEPGFQTSENCLSVQTEDIEVLSAPFPAPFPPPALSVGKTPSVISSDVMRGEAHGLQQVEHRGMRLEDVRVSGSELDFFCAPPHPDTRSKVGGDLLLFDVSQRVESTSHRLTVLEERLARHDTNMRWQTAAGSAAAALLAIGGFALLHDSGSERDTAIVLPSPSTTSLTSEVVVADTIAPIVVAPLPTEVTTATQTTEVPIALPDATTIPHESPESPDQAVDVGIPGAVSTPRADIPPEPTVATTTTVPPTETTLKVMYSDVLWGDSSVQIVKGGYLSHLLIQYNKLCGTSLSIETFTSRLKELNSDEAVNNWVAGTNIKLPAAGDWCE